MINYTRTNQLLQLLKIIILLIELLQNTEMSILPHKIMSIVPTLIPQQDARPQLFLIIHSYRVCLHMFESFRKTLMRAQVESRVWEDICLPHVPAFRRVILLYMYYIQAHCVSQTREHCGRLRVRDTPITACAYRCRFHTRIFSSRNRFSYE